MRNRSRPGTGGDAKGMVMSGVRLARRRRYTGVVRPSGPFLPLLLWSLASHCQTAPASLRGAQPADAQALVERALANELLAAQDTSHPMRYKLRKTSPRLTTVKLICETADGAVARLISVDGQPLSTMDENKEQVRLDGLLNDPGRQRHRKQSEQDDANRAMKVLRALPKAFLYTPVNGDAGAASAGIARYDFKPNPKFDPADLETEALSAMSGELWIDTAKERVIHLSGHLDDDVDFGWGILGRLAKGGTILLEQADVGDGQWRLTHFQMAIHGRVLFKAKVFDTEEVESEFAPVPADTTYQKAIGMLRAKEPAAPTSATTTETKPCP